jgi:RHS repeat-associated protein
MEYRWDIRDRLTGITVKNDLGEIIRTAEYTYDVYNQRIAKTVDTDGDGVAVAKTERYVYGRDQNIGLVFDENGNVNHRYLFGDGVDQIEADESNGNVLWALTDHLGSVRDVVDDSGTVLNHVVYDAFGGVTTQTDESVVFRYGYTAREFDAESGLQYNRARYLDSFTGKFISEDPISFEGGDSNLYRYVENSPINYTDATGLLRRSAGLLQLPEGSGGGGSGSGIFNSAGSSRAVAPPSNYNYANPPATGNLSRPDNVFRLNDLGNRARPVLPQPQNNSNPLGIFDLGRALEPYRPDPNSCKEDDNDNYPCKSPRMILGDSYKEVFDNTSGDRQVHHAPAWSAIENSGIYLGTLGNRGRNIAPGFCMKSADHGQTASYKGNKYSAKGYYRDGQSYLISLGSYGFELAQNLDVVDVRGKFGAKYDFGIMQMQNYTRKLQSDHPEYFKIKQ